MGYMPFFWTEDNGMQDTIGMLDPNSKPILYTTFSG
jgi:hypothetical protein